MKIALIGASGFVGSNLIDELIKSVPDIQIIASDLVPPSGPATPQVTFLKTNVLDQQNVLDAIQDCEVVFHLASGEVKASLSDAKNDMRVNVEGTLNVLEAARKANVKKIVYSSSSSVIGIAKYLPVDESHPCIPKTPYAVAKLACENYIRLYNELYGLSSIIFRFFNVYGPRERTERGAPVSSILSKVAKRVPVTVTGDGSQTRDFIYVQDLVSFLVKASTLKNNHELINLGTGNQTSILELAKICGEIVGTAPKIEFLPSRAGDTQNFYADTTKLKSIFSEVPQTTLQEGVALTYSWLVHAKIV